MDKVPKTSSSISLLQDQFYIEYSAIRIFQLLSFCLLQENEQEFPDSKDFMTPIFR
jgi:hypothetical protein